MLSKVFRVERGNNCQERVHKFAGVDKVAFPPIIIGEKLLKIRGWGRISAQGRVKNLLKAGKSQTDLICLNHWGNNSSLGRPI